MSVSKDAALIKLRDIFINRDIANLLSGIHWISRLLAGYQYNIISVSAFSIYIGCDFRKKEIFLGNFIYQMYTDNRSNCSSVVH